MATIDNLINDLGGKKKAFKQAIIDSTTIAIEDAILIIQQRVQETGTDAKGKKFKRYTEAYVKFKRGGTYFTRTNPPQKKKRPNRTGNGLVNLTYTGEMWRSIGIISSKNENDLFTIVAGGRDKETKDKMKWNSVKRPFFFLSNKETKQITQDWRERITKNKNLIFK